MLKEFLTLILSYCPYLERLVKPTDNVWTVKETFKLPSDHVEFARLVFRSTAICPPTYSTNQVPLTSRPHREAIYSDDETSSRGRSSSAAPGSQPRRAVSPRPSSAIGAPGSPARSRRADVENHHRSRLEGAIASDNDPVSSDDAFHSPPLSPRRSMKEPISPRQSPRRPRRMSIGGGSSSNLVSQSSGTSLSSSQTIAPSTMSSSSSIPVITPARVDSTVVWADFLEATHLVASCNLFKPKDPLDTVQLAALHFYVFSLQSPPSDSSSRKERAKSHGASGRDGTPERQRDSSGPLSVHIEESPATSKLYRKSLHKNVGAFYPVRLMSSSLKGSVLEDSIWSSYVECTTKKLTVEDAMQEYTKIFNQWKYSGVRLFFDVKRDFSAILSPKPSVLALNEDGIIIMKNHKENEIIASYLYTNISHWTVIGNMLSLEVLVDDASNGGASGNLTEPNSQNGDQSSSSNPNSARSPLQPSYLGATTTVLFSSSQIETISAIMQFYIDRLTQLVFERADALRTEPSPRPFLVTDVAHPERSPSSSSHKINVDSLGPALRQLRDERGETSGAASSTSDSDRESAAASMFLMSPSSDSVHRTKANSPSGTSLPHPGSASSPVLGRRRSPSLSRRGDEQKIDHLRSSDHLEEGFTSQDGPRRQATKSKRAPGSGSFRGLSARQSDTESKGSESDRERLQSSLGITTDGSESDLFLSSRPDSPSPHHLASSTSSVDQLPHFTHDTSTSESFQP